MGKRLHGERGATAVLMALSAVGLLAFSGLVVDGGNQFSQRRQMQNSADASATAGANALYRYRMGIGGPEKIYADALKSAAGQRCGHRVLHLLARPSGQQWG